jgi:hypothetical protein
MNQIITIPTEYFQAISSFRAVGDIRFYLNGVLLETGPQGAFVVATDGSAMAAARFLMDKEPMAETQVVIPLNIVEQIEKLKIRKNPAFSIEMPEKAGNFDGLQRRKITLKTIDYEVQFDEVEATYPQWRKVARHTFDGTAALYAPKYISRVDDAARLIKGRKGGLMTLLRPGANNTCGFAWLDNGGRACVWVAPIERGKLDQMPGAPAWEV